LAGTWKCNCFRISTKYGVYQSMLKDKPVNMISFLLAISENKSLRFIFCVSKIFLKKFEFFYFFRFKLILF